MRTHMAERFDRERDAEPLRAAAKTMSAAFPDDWRTATFEVELERTADGASVVITSYAISGVYSEQAGGVCG